MTQRQCGYPFKFEKDCKLPIGCAQDTQQTQSGSGARSSRDEVMCADGLEEPLDGAHFARQRHRMSGDERQTTQRRYSRDCTRQDG